MTDLEVSISKSGTAISERLRKEPKEASRAKQKSPEALKPKVERLT